MQNKQLGLNQIVATLFRCGELYSKDCQAKWCLQQMQLRSWMHQSAIKLEWSENIRTIPICCQTMLSKLTQTASLMKSFPFEASLGFGRFKINFKLETETNLLTQAPDNGQTPVDALWWHSNKAINLFMR
jgi:hypothetical protein